MWGGYSGVVRGRGSSCCGRGGTTDGSVDNGIGDIACEGLNGWGGTTGRGRIFSGECSHSVPVCMLKALGGVSGLDCLCLLLVCHLILGAGLETSVRTEAMKGKGTGNYFLIVEGTVVEIGTPDHDGMSRCQLLWQSHHTGQKHCLTINQHEQWERPLP